MFIFILSLLTALVFAANIVLRKRAERVIHPLGDKRYGVNGDGAITREDAVYLRFRRNLVVFSYSLYANFTAIFPLLGIFGTVAALVTYDPSTDENMMASLMTALTTTLNGVAWAIMYKALDSFLSSPLDAFLDDVEYIIRKSEGLDYNTDGKLSDQTGARK